MLKAVEDISQTKKRLKIEVPQSAIEKEFADAFGRLRAKVKLPGFRQGKAPVDLLERRFGKEVESEVLEKVVSESYREALKEAGIIPVATPVFEEGVDFKRDTPLSMTLTVEIMPTLQTPVYEGMTVKDIPVAVSEEDIEGTLKRLRADKTPYEPSEEGLSAGDIAVIDIRDGALEFNDQLVRIGDKIFPSALSAGLSGKKKGDTANLKVSFPEGFHITGLAGKEADISASVKEVKKPNPPALDGEFAKDVGFDSLDALKGHIREELLKAKTDAVRRIQKAEAMKKVVEANEFEVPGSLLERELAHLLAETRQEGKEGADALREKLRPSAERNVRAGLLLEAIGRKEAIEVSEEELKGELRTLGGKLRLSPENVMKYFIAKDGSLDGLRHMLFEEKVLKLLLEKAIIEKEGK